MVLLDPSLPAELSEAIEQELDQGERVVWADRPIPSWFAPEAMAAFLFAIPWTAFALFWMAMASSGLGSGSGPESSPFRWIALIFPVFGLPFVLIGLAMLASPWWFYRKALRTAYVLTDRRALIIQGGRTKHVRSFHPDQLTTILRRERRDGSGDVIYAKDVGVDNDNQRTQKPVGFFRVRDVRTVERHLNVLARDGRKADEHSANAE